MRRGDIVTVALCGDNGKPRPAVIIQSNLLPPTKSVLICPFSTTLREVPLIRLGVDANAETGLRRPSQIMVEKITAIRRDRVGPRIGRLDKATLTALDQILAFVIGIADRGGAETVDDPSD